MACTSRSGGTRGCSPIDPGGDGRAAGPGVRSTPARETLARWRNLGRSTYSSAAARRTRSDGSWRKDISACAARARAPQGKPRIRRFDPADARRTLLDFAPNLWEKLRGIADGLGMTLEAAAAACSNGRLAYPPRGCSAASGGGLYARNYDFSPRRYDRGSSPCRRAASMPASASPTDTPAGSTA